MRHVANPDFGAVIFRRTSPQITNEGGLWDESVKLYPLAGGVPRTGCLDWRFPSGATITFAHLQHEETKLDWQGSQIALIGFDELTHFSAGQFWYLLSRNRSMCGVKPYIRAGCNPDAGSWVAELIAWWIDQGSGLPIPERSGVKRWFIRLHGEMEWGDTAEELMVRFPGERPYSLTFVAATLDDNQILLAKNPEYRSALMALPHIEQERLLKGNWKISSVDGEWPPAYFGPDIWFDDWPDEKDILLRGMALDPSKGKKKDEGGTNVGPKKASVRVPDYSAFVWGAAVRGGKVYIDADLDNRRDTVRIVEDGIRLFKEFNPAGLLVEGNQFQEMLALEFVRLAKLNAIPFGRFYTVDNYVSKLVRIRTLGPLLAQGVFRFRRTPGGRLLVRQLMDFPNGQWDDGPDALEFLIRLLNFLMRGPQAGAAQPKPVRA